MAYKFLILPQAEKQLAGMDETAARRVLKKLTWFSKQTDPLRFATPLHNTKIGDARFRIGDYRAVAIVDKKKGVIAVAAVGHRRWIYK